MKRLFALVTILAAFSSYSDEWYPCFSIVSGDKVVLNDNTYVLLTEEHFANLITNMQILATIAEKRWKVQHSTDQGRVEWHGSRKNTIITNGTMVTIYADGYRFVEKFKERKQSAPKPIHEPGKPDYSKMPPRLRSAKMGVDFVKEVK